MRVNLFGGPGIGKSTQALDLCYKLKVAGVKIEYVSEYAKTWAYENRKPTPISQIFISSTQLYHELRVLQHGVPHVVTDSPLLLAAVYADFYGGDKKVSDHIKNMVKIMDEYCPPINILLTRDDKFYDSSARFQTLEECKIIDAKIEEVLQEVYGLDAVMRVDPTSKNVKDIVVKRIKRLLAS